MKKLKGFTLIEILLVIGIIAILVAVLLAALDPVEQIRKAQDTGMLTKAKEVIGASERFYTSFLADPNNCGDINVAIYSNLIGNGELKSTFNWAGLNWATTPTGCTGGNTGNYAVMFNPASKVWKNKCLGSGGLGGTQCWIPNEAM